ncbi:MAG: MBOAT family protein [Bacteroidales bacterium]|nr:MBOAT family protein [Bacteroidales bacterium]
MDITSLYFLSFSVISIFIYYLLKNEYRVLFLTLLSCGFIATYSYVLLIYVIAYSFINYIIGLKIPNQRIKRILFTTGIVINLTQLLLLKYVSFTINPLFDLLKIDLDFTVISKIIIPVGVSFFTLQGIGYLVNVNLGWEKPERNFINFLLYISFFPRFLSGPIDRSNHFLPQLSLNKSFDGQKIAEGFRLVLFGLFKKVAIANQLVPIVNMAYANIEHSSEFSLWAVMLIQPLYLYFDFSGYTDIAFGFARAYGLELRPNFNRPFMSENMTEFWKRFHISLSSWFHDYIFIRTSYRYRKWGRKASNFALFLTWVLFGIWHGAGWNFMLLGFLQAIAIYYEFSTKRLRVRIFSKLPDIFRIWLGRICTYLFYSTALVFFFAPDIDSVFAFFSKLPLLSGTLPGGVRDEIFLLVMIFISVILIFEILKHDFGNIFDKIEFYWLSKKNTFRIVRWAIYCILITIIIVFNSEVQQFIYFQF